MNHKFLVLAFGIFLLIQGVSPPVAASDHVVVVDVSTVDVNCPQGPYCYDISHSQLEAGQLVELRYHGGPMGNITHTLQVDWTGNGIPDAELQDPGEGYSSVQFTVPGNVQTIVLKCGVPGHAEEGEEGSIFVVSTNQPPVADAFVEVDGRSATIDASASFDPDGVIVEYRFSWGDGTTTTRTDPMATHTYAQDGSYSASVRVMDDQGATSLRNLQIVIKEGDEAPQPPTAVLEVSVNDLTVTADASGSTAVQGVLVDYRFDWGDGEITQGAVSSRMHTYSEPGPYTVTLRVTDGQGLVAEASRDVTLETADVDEGLGSAAVTDRAGAAVVGAPIVLLQALQQDSDDVGGTSGVKRLVPLGSTVTGVDGRYLLPSTVDGITHVAVTDGNRLLIDGLRNGNAPGFIVPPELIGDVAPEDVKDLEDALEEIRLFPVGNVMEGRRVEASAGGYLGIEGVRFEAQETRDGVSLAVASMKDKGNPRIPEPAGQRLQTFGLALLDADAEYVPIEWIELVFSDLPDTRDIDRIAIAHFLGSRGEWELATLKPDGDRFVARFDSLSLFAVVETQPGLLSSVTQILTGTPWVGVVAIGAGVVVVVAFVAQKSGVAGVLLKRKTSRRSASARGPLGAVVSPRVGEDLEGEALMVSELSFDAGGHSILKGVTFAMEKGEILALLGPSGCGKSTLLKCILGENRFRGEARVFGFDPLNDRDRLKPVVGFVAQQDQLYGDMTVSENVRYFGNLYGSPEEVKMNTPWVLKTLGLDHRADEKADRLSGGERRRASIAATLIHSPALIVLDEPTSGLDPVTRRNLWNHLRQLNRESGISVVVTTHFLDEAEYANQVVVLDAGRLVTAGSPVELVRSLPGGGKMVVAELLSLSQSAKEKLDGAAQRLKDDVGVEKVDISGYTVRFFTSDPQHASGAVIQILNELELMVKSVTTAECTIEDVFVHYTGREWEENGG